MGAVSYGEVDLRGKLVRSSAYRGDVRVQDGARSIDDHLECYDPATRGQKCPGTYRPDAVTDIDGSGYFAGANYYMDDPDVRGADLSPLMNGDYYGILMAKTYILIVRPISQVEPETYQRLGSIWMSGLSSLESDKSLFFKDTEPRVLRLV